MADRRIKGGLVAVVLLLAGCDDGLDTELAPRVQQVSAAEVSFVKSVLDDLQARSFAQNREFCGFIGLTPQGRFTATKARRGNQNSCVPRDMAKGVVVLASYHTHGAASGRYVTEFPAFEDMYQDIVAGVDGYISTPGGRIWYNDARARLSNLLCGLACVTADPNHHDREYLPVGTALTLDDLRGE